MFWPSGKAVAKLVRDRFVRSAADVSIAYAATPVDVYPRLIRGLHWAMAAGFALVWLTGVLTINLEGLGSESWDARQAAVRSLHKSLALTLVALTIIRIFARWLLPNPPLPSEIAGVQRRLAHAGHAGLYLLIFLTSAAGLGHRGSPGFRERLFRGAAAKALSDARSRAGLAG